MDLISFVKAAGYVGVTGIVFAESGLLVGFFLPGDSLLFTAGLLAGQGFLNIWWLLLLTSLAAVIGDNVGYGFGLKYGRRLFEKEEGRFFKRDNLLKAEKFYELYGSRAIILARFMPIVRTFAPIVAGIGKMDYKTFARNNLIGGVIWACGVTAAGSFLGSRVPSIDKYLLPIIGVIVILSLIPVYRELRANKRPPRS